MKHTPAPWWIDDDGFIAAGSGDSYVTVADFDCSDLDIAEREANKQLACAAPELYSSLEGLVADLQIMYFQFGLDKMVGIKTRLKEAEELLNRLENAA